MTNEEITNEYLKPWTTYDSQGQYDCGYREGYEQGKKSGGYPDGPLDSTHYGRGYYAGYEAAQREKK
jgi:hypothetical protein